MSPPLPISPNNRPCWLEKPRISSFSATIENIQPVQKVQTARRYTISWLREHWCVSTGLIWFSYLPALYDPSTRTLHINPSTPLYLISHQVKRLRNAPLTSTATAEQRMERRVKRNDLGEVFGTRKAKSQIRAEERNRVDVGGMQGFKGLLMKSIEGKVIEEGMFRCRSLE